MCKYLVIDKTSKRYGKIGQAWRTIYERSSLGSRVCRVHLSFGRDIGQFPIENVIYVGDNIKLSSHKLGAFYE